MVLSPLALTASAFASGTTKIPKPDTVSPGFAGFLAIFLLTCATILLMRSMTKHLRKVRYSPDPSAVPQPRPSAPAQGRPAGPAEVRAAGPDGPAEDHPKPS